MGLKSSAWFAFGAIYSGSFTFVLYYYCLKRCLFHSLCQLVWWSNSEVLMLGRQKLRWLQLVSFGRKQETSLQMGRLFAILLEDSCFVFNRAKGTSPFERWRLEWNYYPSCPGCFLEVRLPSIVVLWWRGKLNLIFLSLLLYRRYVSWFLNLGFDRSSIFELSIFGGLETNV